MTNNELIEVRPGDIQAAWDAVDSLPPIDFTESEEADLIEALVNIASLRARHGEGEGA